MFVTIFPDFTLIVWKLIILTKLLAELLATIQNSCTFADLLADWVSLRPY